jgi:hypothetical protein
MPGDAAEPHVAAEQLTRDGLLAIDRSWGGEVDQSSLSMAQAIVAALDAERPWRRSEDPSQMLSWAADIDTSTPHPARMYDYNLGGAHNFETGSGPRWSSLTSRASAGTPGSTGTSSTVSPRTGMRWRPGAGSRSRTPAHQASKAQGLRQPTRPTTLRPCQ